MNHIGKFFKRAANEGLSFPLAKDTARPGKPPSVTLFFLYVTNVLAILSLLCLHFRSDALVATSATCIYGIIWASLYLIRKLQHVKFDLDDQEIELDSGEESEEKSE